MTEVFFVLNVPKFVPQVNFSSWRSMYQGLTVNWKKVDNPLTIRYVPKCEFD